MRILHYTLGFPPYRSGGLTRYAIDLMAAQIELGHNVSALYPGSISFFKKKCHIIQTKPKGKINIYEIKNPKPVPLLYGLQDVDDIINDEKLAITSLNKMLDEIRPDIFHVHTFMGIPLKYLEIIHERGIKTVYTSHDYFGLCAKVNFIDAFGIACQEASADRCATCNRNAKSTLFLRLRNAKCLIPIKHIAKRIKR